MSSQPMDLQLLAATSILVLLVFVVWRRSTSSALPPGPVCWPLVGCLFSLKQPLHRHFAKLAKRHGPIMYFKVGMVPMVVVSSSDIAKELLKAHDLEFSFRPPTKFFEVYSEGFINLAMGSPEDESWKIMRKLALVHVFSSAKLSSTTSCREVEVKSLICSLLKVPQSEFVSLREKLGELNANTMFTLLFGTKPENEWVRATLKALDMLTSSALNCNIGELFPSLSRFDVHGIYRKVNEVLLPQFKAVVSHMIDRHHQRGENKHPMDVLQSLQDQGALNQACVMAFLMDMVTTGISTSQSVTEWAMAEVMSNPEVMRKAQQEIDDLVGPTRLVQEADLPKLPYVQAIVKETLRLHPAVPLNIPHYNPKASTLGGYSIPPKCQVLVNIWAMARDGAVWEDPEKFMPERFMRADINVTGQNFQFIPFSSGKRMCSGYPLAMRSIPLAVATLVHAFDWKHRPGYRLEEAGGMHGCTLASKLEASATPRLSKSAYY